MWSCFFFASIIITLYSIVQNTTNLSTGIRMWIVWFQSDFFEECWRWFLFRFFWKLQEACALCLLWQDSGNLNQSLCPLMFLSILLSSCFCLYFPPRLFTSLIRLSLRVHVSVSGLLLRLMRGDSIGLHIPLINLVSSTCLVHADELPTCNAACVCVCVCQRRKKIKCVWSEWVLKGKYRWLEECPLMVSRQAGQFVIGDRRWSRQLTAGLQILFKWSWAILEPSVLGWDEIRTDKRR